MNLRRLYSSVRRIFSPLATENLKQKLRTLWERLLQEDGTERQQDIAGTITQYVGQMERVSVPVGGGSGAELMANTQTPRKNKMITTTRKNQGARGMKDSATWLSREQLSLTECVHSAISTALTGHLLYVLGTSESRGSRHKFLGSSLWSRAGDGATVR